MQRLETRPADGGALEELVFAKSTYLASRWLPWPQPALL